MKYVKTYESFSNNEIDDMIEKANKYLSSDAFAKSVNILPNYIKRKIVKFIELNSGKILGAGPNTNKVCALPCNH